MPRSLKGNFVRGGGVQAAVMARLTLAIFLVFCGAFSGRAALLPEALGDFVRAEPRPYVPEDAPLYFEFGFETGEAARFATPAGQAVEITASRFHDTTGAFAAFQWLQPESGKPIPYGEAALEDGDTLLIKFGNYVLQLKGVLPLEENIELMLGFLPRVELNVLPPFLQYIPKDDLVANSERHIIGPVALERLAPRIPPSVAAFHFNSEAQYQRFQTPAGELKMLVFNYPSPQMSRSQIEEFNKLDGVLARRDGTLIAAVLSPAPADEAERLLAKVQYRAAVTATAREASRHDNIGTLILDIVILCLALIGFMIAGGVVMAGFRIAMRRLAPDSIFAPTPDDATITRLNIDVHGGDPGMQPR
jgi:hypothetical protein